MDEIMDDIMAEMECECGENLFITSEDSDITLWAFPDGQLEEILATGQAGQLDLTDAKFEIWRCPKCKRLYIFTYPSEQASTYETVGGEAGCARDTSYERWHAYREGDWNDICEIDPLNFPDSPIKITVSEDGTQLFLYDSTDGTDLEYRFVPDPLEPTPKFRESPDQES